MCFHAPGSEYSDDLGGGFLEDDPAVKGKDRVVGEEKVGEEEAGPLSGWLAVFEGEV